MDKNVKLRDSQGDVLFPATKSHIVEYDSKDSELGVATVKDAIDLVASNITQQSNRIGIIEGDLPGIKEDLELALSDTSSMKDDISNVSDKADTNETHISALAEAVQGIVTGVKEQGENISEINSYLMEHDAKKIETGSSDW